MAEDSGWGRNERAEQETLDTLLGYLRDQGELDDSDLGQLHSIAYERKATLTLEGWQQISDQLFKQNEDELAKMFIPEPDRSVDDVLEYLRTNSQLKAEWTVFVGAGGSKPDPTGLPLVSELLPTLWQKATEINARHLLDLQKRCANLGIENIEDLLTAIDITRSAADKPLVRRLVQDLLLGPSDPMRRDSDLGFGVARRPRRRPADEGLQDSGLVDHLQESMQTLFSLLVGMMRMAKPNGFHDALSRRASGPAPLSVVTTNYDVCVERALGTYLYGGIEDLRPDTAAVLKLHGSLNWFACSSCDELVAARLDDIEALTRARLFPVVSQCPECDALAPHLIVPPVGNKIAEHPVLLEVRQQAENAMTRCPVVAFVGYSFNEADEYVLRMVSRAVAASKTKILIFDIQRDSESRLKAFLTAHARNYDADENVTYIGGDAARTFPEFVNRWEQATRESTAAFVPNES